MARRAPLLLATALAATGCGGGPANSGEDGVRAVIADYEAAVRERDPAAVCATYTRQSQAGVEALGEPCPELFRPLLEEAPRDFRVEVRRVRVQADRASAEVLEDGEAQTLALEREDGEWRLVDEAFAPASEPSGGPPPDREAARAAGEAGVRGAIALHAAAQRARDAASMCVSVTRATRELVARRGGSCEAAYGARFRAPRFEPVGLEVRRVALDGDRATAVVVVRYQGERLEQRFRLRREAGAWRLDLTDGG